MSNRDWHIDGGKFMTPWFDVIDALRAMLETFGMRDPKTYLPDERAVIENARKALGITVVTDDVEPLSEEELRARASNAVIEGEEGKL